jgi:hypothetical protein
VDFSTKTASALNELIIRCERTYKTFSVETRNQIKVNADEENHLTKEP